MTDIIKEARALLARLNEGAFAWGNAHANQQGERLLAALADECERLSSALDAMTNQAVMASGRRATIVTDDGELERLRAENAQHVDFRASINEALPRPFGVTVLGAIAELRAENARLREAMPGDDVRDEINDASVMLHEDGGMPATLAWLARLDAARKGE